MNKKLIWLAYAKEYIKIFRSLFRSDKHNAAKTGIRALKYIAQTGDFDQKETLALLGKLIDDLVPNTENTQQLHDIITELQRVIEQIPNGRFRWHTRGMLEPVLKIPSRADRDRAYLSS